MVEATPIKLSYVIYPGETLYDSQLVAIEEDRLVFRHEKRWSDGRVEKSVEMKPLRPSNAVTDMTATKETKAGGSASATPAADPSKNVEEKKSASEKQ
jgi:hypothetical protein